MAWIVKLSPQAWVSRLIVRAKITIDDLLLIVGQFFDKLCREMRNGHLIGFTQREACPTPDVASRTLVCTRSWYQSVRGVNNIAGGSTGIPCWASIELYVLK